MRGESRGGKPESRQWSLVERPDSEQEGKTPEISVEHRLEDVDQHLKLDIGSAYSHVASELVTIIGTQGAGTTHEPDIRAQNKLLLLAKKLNREGIGFDFGRLNRAVTEQCKKRKTVPPLPGEISKALDCIAAGSDGMLFALDRLDKDFAKESGGDSGRFVGLNVELDGKWQVDAVEIIYDRPEEEGDVPHVREINLVQAKRGPVSPGEVSSIQKRHQELAGRLMTVETLAESIRKRAEFERARNVRRRLADGSLSMEELSETVAQLLLSIEEEMDRREQRAADAIESEPGGIESALEGAPVIEESEEGLVNVPPSEGRDVMTLAPLSASEVDEIVRRSDIPRSDIRTLMSNKQWSAALEDYYRQMLTEEGGIESQLHEEELQSLREWATSGEPSDEELAERLALDESWKGAPSFYRLNSVVVHDRGKGLEKRRLEMDDKSPGIVKSR